MKPKKEQPTVTQLLYVYTPKAWGQINEEYPDKNKSSGVLNLCRAADLSMLSKAISGQKAYHQSKINFEISKFCR